MDSCSFPRLPGTRTALVGCVNDIPLVPGLFVACDLDDTIIKSHWKSQGRFHQQREVTLMHPDDVAWCERATSLGTLVYITSREPTTATITEQNLQLLGLPLRPVHFTQDKGPTLAHLVAYYQATEIVFVDDLDENHRSVEQAVPSAHCFRVDPRLAQKFKARRKRHERNLEQPQTNAQPHSS